ncbi:MAG: dihydrofolate reductase family protein [Candidatus Woesearchaeota archaeon]
MITLYMTMTVNGMIALPDGGVPWTKESWQRYQELAKTFPAIILGRKTFELMQEGDEFKTIGNPYVVVLSKKLKEMKGADDFASSPEEAVHILKKNKFDKVLLGGGAHVNRVFLDAGLVDEVILDVEPRIWGEGMPLFALGGDETEMQLKDVTRTDSGIVRLKYSVRRKK